MMYFVLVVIVVVFVVSLKTLCLCLICFLHHGDAVPIGGWLISTVFNVWPRRTNASHFFQNSYTSSSSFVFRAIRFIQIDIRNHFICRLSLKKENALSFSHLHEALAGADTQIKENFMWKSLFVRCIFFCFCSWLSSTRCVYVFCDFWIFIRRLHCQTYRLNVTWIVVFC